MALSTITLSREELFDLVWTKPLSKLCIELGLSDVGLKKTCMRYNIPTPPAGYWAKIANGRKVPSKPTLSLFNNSSNIIEFQLDNRLEEEQERRKKYSYVYDDYGQINKNKIKQEILQSFKELHPLLKDSYRNTSSYFSGITVSDKLRDRAYRLAHSIFKVLESQGFKVNLQNNDNGTRTVVFVKDTVVGILITEKSKRVEHNNANNKYSFMDKKYDFIPSGYLTVKIGSHYYFQKEWSDTKKTLLEDRLSDIAEGLLNYAINDKIDNIERTERHRQWEEKEIADAKLQKMIEQHEKALKRLITNANSWRQSNDIKDYITFVKLTADLNGSINNDLEEWITWATNEANAMVNCEPFKTQDSNDDDDYE